MNINLTGGYAKATIDGNIYQLTTFSEENVNKILTTNIELGNGTYTLTSFQLYDENDVLLGEDTTPQTFDVDVSFTTELPVELVFLEGGDVTMRLEVTGLDYGFVYTKSQELPAPPQSETKTVSFVSLIGIIEEEKHLYNADIVYDAAHPVSTIEKMKFAIIWYHREGLNGVPTLQYFTHYEYGESVPLEVTYEKSNNPNDMDYFSVQAYYAMKNPQTGDVFMTNSNMGWDGPWTIAIPGDGDFVYNDKGLVEFSFYPTSQWASDMDYQMLYREFHFGTGVTYI